MLTVPTTPREKWVLLALPHGVTNVSSRVDCLPADIGNNARGIPASRKAGTIENTAEGFSPSRRAISPFSPLNGISRTASLGTIKRYTRLHREVSSAVSRLPLGIFKFCAEVLANANAVTAALVNRNLEIRSLGRLLKNPMLMSSLPSNATQREMTISSPRLATCKPKVFWVTRTKAAISLVGSVPLNVRPAA